MPKYISILLISLVCCLFSFGQKVLKGKIISADTRKPIVSANIFLSNTSVGTVSDENGEFSINRFPEGRFDLVVSFIGYTTYHITVQSNHLPALLDILLQPKTEELKEVIVESYDKYGWDKWGGIFTENFMGTSEFARDCKLLNKEVVKFRFDKKRNTVKATGEDQLVIENNALGYTLKYNLTQFEFNLDTKEFFYEGYPYFEEMQTNRKGLEKRWVANRELAYYGSLTHFMRSLYRNQLLEQQFEIRKWVAVPEEERNRIKKIYPVQSKKIQSTRNTNTTSNGNSASVVDTGNLIQADSLLYYRSIMQQIAEKNILINCLIPADSIAFAVDSVTVGFLFDDHLQVLYRPKTPPAEYQKHISKDLLYSPVSSEIYQTAHKTMLVLANGSYFEGLHLMILGYWAWWEKMCTKLPFDYWPHAPKIKP